MVPFQRAQKGVCSSIVCWEQRAAPPVLHCIAVLNCTLCGHVFIWCVQEQDLYALVLHATFSKVSSEYLCSLCLCLRIDMFVQSGRQALKYFLLPAK